MSVGNVSHCSVCFLIYNFLIIPLKTTPDSTKYHSEISLRTWTLSPAPLCHMYCQKVFSGPVPIGTVRRAVGAVRRWCGWQPRAQGMSGISGSPRVSEQRNISHFLVCMHYDSGYWGAAHVPLLRGRMAYCVKWGLVIHGALIWAWWRDFGSAQAES